MPSKKRKVQSKLKNVKPKVKNVRKKPKKEFCQQCGKLFVNKKCPNINHIKFNNPIPVAVALVAIKDEETGKISLLGVRRGIMPFIGKLALPGGFQEIESIHHAAARELEEETGVVLEKFIKEGPLFSQDVRISSTPDNTRNLMFFKANIVLNKKDVDMSFKTKETQELILIDADTEDHAFSLHKEAVDWFFKK